MFWSIVNPLLYTFITIIAFVTLATLFPPKKNSTRLKSFRVSTLLSIALFFPLLVFFNRVLEDYRFGVFQYDDYDSVSESMAKTWLPPTAANFTIHQRNQGFEAKYSISRRELEDWLDRFWKEREARSRTKREDSLSCSDIDYSDPDSEDSSRVGWPYTKDAILYEGPRKSNWAGFTIWYNEADGTAYQDAGYW